MSQPIARGIQAAGAVNVWYRYNGPGGLLPVPSTIKIQDKDGARVTQIDTSARIRLCGFLLDQDFLKANPQVASSAVFPVLGGGGVAVTNNNRTGQLVLVCTKVSTPRTESGAMAPMEEVEGADGKYYDGIGITPDGDYKNSYDATLISQIQQAQLGGGDSYGATICVEFMFNGRKTSLEFQGCTVSSVEPITLSGIRPGTYPIAWNYLNWGATYFTTKVPTGGKDVEYMTVQPNADWTD